MTECNGCGRCCDPVVLAVSPIQIQTAPLEAMGEHADNIRWMREDLTPIPRREGLDLVGDYMRQGAKTAGSATPTSEPVILFSFFYRCRHFDAETRRCMAYERRPPACRAYPWNDSPPDSSLALPSECSFRADIGQPVVLGPTRR